MSRNGNWFDYMPELGDPRTEDLIAERPSVSTLFAKPQRKPVMAAPPARKPVEAEQGAARPVETEAPVTGLDDGARLTVSPLSFILAGKAFFTLVSKRTGKRYTYRVSQAEAKDGGNAPWFVSLLTGPDNWANYSYLGLIGGSDKRFRLTSKSKFNHNAEPVKAFDWVYSHLLRGVEPPSVEIWHNGKCGRCGRMLTVPESIANGIGPECLKKGMAA